MMRRMRERVRKRGEDYQGDIVVDDDCQNCCERQLIGPMVTVLLEIIGDRDGDDRNPGMNDLHQSGNLNKRVFNIP